MVLKADYHVHTNLSDGKSSIESVVTAAIDKGLECVCITDHGFSNILCAMSTEKAVYARGEIDRLNAIYGGKVKILLGVEANLLNLDGLTDIHGLDRSMFDVVLLAYHFSARHSRQMVLSYMKALTANMKKRRTERFTRAFMRAMERYDITIIAHPCHPADLDMRLLAQCAKEHNTALEISCKHPIDYRKLVPALDTGVAYVISSDAHEAMNVGRFDVGLRIAECAGIGEDRIVNNTLWKQLGVRD